MYPQRKICQQEHEKKCLQNSTVYLFIPYIIYVLISLLYKLFTFSVCTCSDERQLTHLFLIHFRILNELKSILKFWGKY